MGLKPSPSGDPLRILLRCSDARISHRISYTLLAQIPFCVGYQISQAYPDRTGQYSLARFSPRDLPSDVEILEGAVSRDHVHILVSCPPNLSPSKLMQYVKGKSSRKLMMEFGHIQKQCWGRHLWARGYFVASSGNVTDEVIQQYIRLQEETNKDDSDENFHVS